MSAQQLLFDAAGPAARRRHLAYGAVGAVLIAAVLFVALRAMADNGQFEAAKWSPFLSSSSWEFYLLPGLISTLKAAAVAIVLSMAFGIALAMARMSDLPALRWAASIFVEFFRSVPVLIMMIFAWTMLVKNEALSSAAASVGISSADVTFVAVVVGLVLYNASVICEVVRSGVTSLPSGQREAGLSIGLSSSQVRRAILVPQALTAMLPALVSQIIVITKDSALGYVITYPELISRTRQLGSAESNTFVAYLVAAAIFILINYSLSKLAEWVEARQRRKGHTAGPVGSAETITQPPPGAAERLDGAHR